MKFMRLGNKPDTFYTEEAQGCRMVISELPSDLTIRIKNITYLLHKFPLVQKCGLLQQLCSEREDTTSITVECHDIPGGADTFELCVKFCYGFKIDLSAHNFVPAICAAKFLRMTESFGKENFVSKLEVFFNLCILERWKDSVVALQTTERFLEWSENLGIIRRCIDSVVDKILTQPSKVRWSYTYTRPEYAQKKHHKAPKDWWTEDVTDLNIDLFRCIINTVRSTNMLPPQLIGEALHVYACHWLPDVTRDMSHPETSTASQMTQEKLVHQKNQLDMIVSLIPEDKGSVSVGFLLRLLSVAKRLRASAVLIAQLINKCGLQLEEATLNDLMLPLHDSSGDHHIYDIELVQVVVEGFIAQCRKSYSRDETSLNLIRNVGKLVDSFLQVVSSDTNMSVQKVVFLANAVPEFARPEHDKIYKAINIYLNEHPEMSKEEKKQLCSILDCQKLSAAARAHVVKNERLPLRTVVQLLFYENQKHDGEAITSRKSQQSIRQPQGRELSEATAGDAQNRLQLYSDDRSTKEESRGRRSGPSNTRQRLDPESEDNTKWKKVIETRSNKAREIIKEESKHDVTKIKIQRSKSAHGRRKVK